MQAAEALVQPLVYQGFGLPIVEAMACGCPVVASDIPVFHEVANEAAVFVPPRDAGALGRTLAELARSPSHRTELSWAGLQRSRQLSWDRTAAATLEVYDEALRCTRLPAAPPPSAARKRSV